MNSLPLGLLALRHDSDYQKKIFLAMLVDKSQKQKPGIRYTQRGGLGIGFVGHLNLGVEKDKVSWVAR